MSFQRRSSQPALAGVKLGLVPSTPTGIPQLDPLLGGGILLGSSLLLVEDRHNVYGRQLLKSFVAEGIVHNQRIFLIDGEVPLALEELPRPIPKLPAKPQSGRSPPGECGDPMKIAFRYERLPQHESLPEGQSDHVLDFGLTIEPETLAKADVVRCSALTQSPEEILIRIASSLSKEKVLRIAMTAGLLLDSGFMRRLRILIRHENAVCWASAPAACLEEDTLQRMYAISDTAISLVAFSSEERHTNPLYRKFHGLLRLDKLAEINSITAVLRPPTIEYTFHQSGKRFAIEQLHLPPDLSEQGLPTMSCQTSGGSKALDF